MPVKQYVNLPADLAQNHGRMIFLEVDVSETMPGAAEGAPVWFFVEPDGGNMPLTKLPRADRQTGAHLDPPNRDFGLVGEEKSATLGLKVSTAGGDKFKFKAAQKSDGSGGMPATTPDEVHVWRKLFLQVAAMPGCEQNVHGFVLDKLKDLFVEVEQVGSHGVGHQGIVTGCGITATAARAQIPPPNVPTPHLAMLLVYVDRYFKDAWVPIERTWVGTQVPENGQLRLEVPGNELTWPEEGQWLQGGRIRMWHPNGELAHDEGNAVVRQITRVSRSGYHHRNPDGYASREIVVELNKISSRMAEWIRDDGVRVRLEMQVRVIRDTPWAGARSDHRACIVAVRDYKYRAGTEPQLRSSTLHEFGHLLGLVQQTDVTYDATSGAETGRAPYPNFYTGHGGQGEHCGLGHQTSGDTWYDGSCVMCGVSDRAHPADFCADCKEMIKRHDYRRLG